MNQLVTDEPLLTTSEMAEALGVHPVTLKRWAGRGTIPRLKNGRYVRYRRSEVEAALRHTPTQPEDRDVEAM